MSRRSFIILIILALFTGIVTYPITAQTVRLNQTYTSDDGAFSFRYPASADIRTEPDGSVIVDLRTVSLLIAPPNTLRELVTVDLEDTSLRRVFTDFLGALPSDVEFDTAFNDTLANGIEVRRADFLNPAALFSVFDAGFVLAVELENTFAVMACGGEDLEEVTEIAYAIATTFEVSETESLDLPTLDEAASGASDAVDELIDLDLVSDEGEIIFNQDMLSTSLGGNELDPDSESQYPNAAMSALLSFRPVDADAVCGFVARTVENDEGGFDEVLFVGVNPANEIMVLAGDRSGERVTETFPTDTDFYSPNQLTFVLRDSRVIVWVNGEPIVDMEVRLTEPNTRGLVPDHQMGTFMANSCVMTGAWGYGFESDEN